MPIGDSSRCCKVVSIVLSGGGAPSIPSRTDFQDKFAGHWVPGGTETLHASAGPPKGTVAASCKVCTAHQPLYRKLSRVLPAAVALVSFRHFQAESA